MQKLFNKILNIFYFKNKIKVYFLFVLSVIAGFFEYLGLVLIFQFVLFLTNPNSIHCKKIIEFFNSYLNIYDFSKISLFLGISIISVYIFKNLYMLLFVKYNNHILEDLSVKISLKILKNLLLAPYITVKNLSNADKLNVLNKVNLVVWQFCYKYIVFYTNIIVALILLSYLFIKFTKVALIAALFISILSIAEYFYLKYRSNFQNKNYTKILDKINSTLLVIINSIKEIKINNKEEYFLSKSEKEYKNLASLNKDRNFNTVIHIYFTEISIMLAFMVILITLFYTTNFDNQLLISSLCTICVVVLRLAPLVNRAQSSLYAINSNKQAVVELIDFDKSFPAFSSFMTDEKLPFEKSIKLENVEFYYDSENYLKNINFEIKKNDYITIIGNSGIGKSTLSLLISGIIQPNKGKILIDNKELKDFKKWQNNVSLLAQDFTFLNDRVDEILNFNNEKTKELIEKICLKNIENKKITELSTGEKQRIALINILMKDKNVIILDEATSNIDKTSQEEMYKILDELKNKKTIIVITHKLETIKDEDKVIYIKNKEEIVFDEYRMIKNLM